MELGLYTFVDRTPDPATGRTVSPEQRMRDLLEEVVLADEVGLDVFGVGEHHRPDYVSSAPAVILAAAAARTSRIRLTTAVSVLSSDDPVRVFQQHATVDLISGGRAEIMAGRGSFVESFPLFGYDLVDYDELFDEKLRLLLEVRRSERVTWQGRHRASIEGCGVYPRPVQDPLPVWLAVGGNPPSVIRAASLGLPMSRRDFDAQRTIHGAFATGSPQEVVEKILFQHEIFGHDRFLLQLTVGTMPHDQVLRAIELYGTEVAPAVRRASGAGRATRARPASAATRR
jgi:alkanesulfonate monooxygenase SsuD/methylene tetrahydromethanopterin reductase-like flavin-dependent oxidoreductase (luciferase family)